MTRSTGQSALAPALGRRAFLLGAGAGAGWLLARGLGVRGAGIGELAAREGDPALYADLLRAFAATLTPRQRELLVLPADHPSRQIANTITVLERPHLGTLLSPAQRALVERLYFSLLSPAGRDAFAGTMAVEGRLDGCVLALYGDVDAGSAQAVLMGGHVMLRGGGESAEGAAFGGGLAYGHQVGNLRWRVEGNSFAPHADAANRLYASLSSDARARAVLPAPPHELVLQVQQADASFPGVRVGSLSEPAQIEAVQLLETVFATFPAAAVVRARSCIAGNGGPEALHVAFFATHGFYEDMTTWAEEAPHERARRGDPYWQVWRIEGPGTVIHFKGYPHVHAYVQVVRDPARANLGEALGVTSGAIEGERMRRVLEGALRRATGEALAFHSDEVPGRFCPGDVTTGLAYSLDPYRNRVAVASIEGRALGAALRARLGSAIEPARLYRVATTEYFASQSKEFGEPSRVERGDLLLRDALVAHLRAGGLGDADA